MSSIQPELGRGVSAPSPAEVIGLGLVEVADTGGHWYWLGDINYDGLDPFPVLYWNGCTWPAIRLLLPRPDGAKVRHVNACGLRTCVNPEHWRLTPYGKGVVLTDFDGKGWRPSR